MRVYLPASLTLLRAWVDAGAAGPPPLTGYAVTPGLRGFFVEADEEELEYAATARAARTSLRLLGAEPRRVVLVAEVPDAAVEARDDLEEGVVRVRSAVAAARFVCALIDDEDAEVAVAEAAAHIDAADLGDEEAAFVVDAVEDHNLQWYARQEFPDLW